MKKAVQALGALSLLLIAFTYFAFSRVDHTPYHFDDYFKRTLERLAQLENDLVVTHGPIQAGFSRVSITPAFNHSNAEWEKGMFEYVPLAGYGARKGQPATGINDSIFVKAMALKSQDQLLVFVTADLLILPPNVTDSLVVHLSETGLKRDQLVFSATHTHSAPGGFGYGRLGTEFAGNYHPDIVRWLVQQMSKAIHSAIDDLKPSRIGSGHFNAAEFTRNRLVNDLGTKNSNFNIVRVEQKGYNSAIIGSFAGHATTLGPENMLISGDYPGYWARKTSQLTSSQAMFFAGSMGSQRPFGEGRGFDRARFIGEALAERTADRYPSVAMHDSLVIATLSLKVNLPSPHIRITPKVSLSSFLSRRIMSYPYHENVYIQAVRIGNLIWLAIPGELSGELANQIINDIRDKGFECMITSFNGSYIGYIIPGKYFYMDKYEPKTMGWFGPYLGDYTMDLSRYLYTILADLE